MPGTHSILPASSAARWLECPPSARLNAAADEQDSSYAAEGTLAHSMCEVKLTGYTVAIPKRTTNAKLNKLRKDPLYQPEMDGYTEEYLDYIKKIALSFSGPAMIRVEERVDFSSYAPEGFGTADCLILFGDELHVVDFKYGKGIKVDAEENPQLRLYALGALERFGFIYNISKVVLHIVQPRLDNFSAWETTAAELRKWGSDVVRPRAALAYEGKGEFRSGEHCRFCKIAATCKKRAEENLALAQYEFRKPPELTSDGSPVLTDDELSEVLTKGAQLKKWYEDMEKYALFAILAGKKISGYKAVEGRGLRAFKSPDEVPARLRAIGLDESLAFTRELLSPAQLEKALGKKVFADNFTELVEKSKGKPTLAPESDKRPAYVSAAEEFSEEKLPF